MAYQQTIMIVLLLVVLVLTVVPAVVQRHVSSCSAPCIIGNESIMSDTSANKHVQASLKWNCDETLANRICNHNRRYAERSGYFLTTTFVATEGQEFYDSNTGRVLFTLQRPTKVFLQESMLHGWPSFRDSEVNWDHVRVLPGGETVSIDGTHLGHNLPDMEGNRYCINLVSIAGNPVVEQDAVEQLQMIKEDVECEGDQCPDDVE